NAGQLIQFLDQAGVGDTKAGNAMFQRGMANIRNFQNTNVDDLDFKANYSAVTKKYDPALDPITRKVSNQEAASQQAAAELNYRSAYNILVKQGMGSPEAALKAKQMTFEKFGDSVEDPKGNLIKGRGVPLSDVDMATVVRGAWNAPGSVVHANIN